MERQGGFGRVRSRLQRITFLPDRAQQPWAWPGEGRGLCPWARLYQSLRVTLGRQLCLSRPSPFSAQGSCGHRGAGRAQERKDHWGGMRTCPLLRLPLLQPSSKASFLSWVHCHHHVPLLKDPRAPLLEPGVLPWSLDRRGGLGSAPVSYTHLTLPTKQVQCRSRWSPYH